MSSTLRFLLDMGLAQSTSSFLRALGHDVVHLREQGLQSLTDEKVVEKSLAEGRTILTHDLDFSRIVALSRGSLPSVITFRLLDMRPVEVNSQLEKILSRFAGELAAGALISVSGHGIRVRSLPVSR